MKVSELIAKLENQDPDAEVLTDNLEEIIDVTTSEGDVILHS